MSESKLQNYAESIGMTYEEYEDDICRNYASIMAKKLKQDSKPTVSAVFDFKGFRLVIEAKKEVLN